MRSLRSARAAVLVLVFGSLVVVASSPSTAADQPPSDVWDPETPAAQQDEITIRAADEGLSEAAAAERFRVEREAVIIQRIARQQWPAELGGVWVDHDPASQIVVGFTDGVEPSADALRAARPSVADKIQGQTSSRSLVSLEAELEQIIQDREAIRNGHTAGLPQALINTGGRFGAGIDQRASAITFDVEVPSSTLLNALSDRYGVEVELDRGIGEPTACTISNCRPRMNGGIELSIDTGYVCSSGFNTYGSGVTSRRYILSAGHCTTITGPGYGRSHAGYTYGSTHSSDNGASLYSGRSDVERVRLTAVGTWDHTNLIRIDGTATRAITSYIGSADYVVGTYIGRTGRTTDTDRGYITHTAYTPSWVPSATASYVRADICSEGGDSGGSVFTGNVAYGIVSGGATLACSNASDWTVFSRMAYALADLSVILQTSDFNDPPVASFVHTCGTLYQCTFTASGYASDIDGSISSYSWNFGDGTTGSGGTITHTFPNAQARTVTLTVQDNGGKTASASTTASPKLL